MASRLGSTMARRGRWERSGTRDELASDVQQTLERGQAEGGDERQGEVPTGQDFFDFLTYFQPVAKLLKNTSRRDREFGWRASVNEDVAAITGGQCGKPHARHLLTRGEMRISFSCASRLTAATMN